MAVAWIAETVCTLEQWADGAWMVFQDGDPAEDPRYVGSWRTRERATESLRRWGYAADGTREEPYGPGTTRTVEVWRRPVQEAPIGWATREEAEAVGRRRR